MISLNHLLVISLSFLSLFSCVALAADEYHYVNPVIFQRFDNTGPNAATPDIPGFYGGASIWVMESNGSYLSLLKHPGSGSAAKHLDHPSITSDGQFFIYAEFENAEIGREGIARLYKENLYTGEREVLRERSNCALHHAALSLDDEVLTYTQECEGVNRLLTEIAGGITAVHPIPASARVSNGVSANMSVVYQNEQRSHAGSGRAIAILLSTFDDQGNRTDRTIADWGFRNRRAAISIDGASVAWQSNSTTGGGTDDILLLNMENSDAAAKKLTQHPANDGHPWFSRDGNSLLFESDRTGNWEIFKLHIPTGVLIQLTDDPSYVSTRPRW